MEKICFAVLVHENREIVEDLIENIEKYCPNSDIVLYNGGKRKKLLKNIGYPVCPFSMPLAYGKNQVFFMLHIMKWLYSEKVDYDYLINLDSDVLFAKHGFEEYVIDRMKDKDFLGVDSQPANPDNYPCQTMWNEWHRWKRLLGMDTFYWCFNNAQVYSRRLVESILFFPKMDLIEKYLQRTKTFAIEEILFITMAKSLGYQIHAHEQDMTLSTRYRPYFTKEEVEKYIMEKKDSYLFHPIYRIWDDEARIFIRELK